MNPYLKILEFDRIIDQLKEYALSESAQNALEKLEPILNEAAAERAMAETTAARKIFDACGTPPLSVMSGLEAMLKEAERGAMLLPEQLTAVARFIGEGRRMAAYLKRGELVDSRVAVLGRAFHAPLELRELIESGVDETRVLDGASPVLRGIRQKLINGEARIREKLNRILLTKRQYLADSYIGERDGQFVLPVLKAYQNVFGGRVVDVSRTGGTVFMTPAGVESLQAELAVLKADEENETRRVLYQLTADTLEYVFVLREDMALMTELDALFAKAKYSAVLNARPARLTGGRTLKLIKARHPLLDAKSCVPLDLEMDETVFGVVITGPNTGGKTVTMKTVGLLSVMAQSGLNIPCAEGSVIPLRDAYFCDIGDSQDISSSLSTFSGHINNIVGILSAAGRDSLVLLDEPGSGTDPLEGMGLAVAILEELKNRGLTFMATTHYPQVKTYAENAEGLLSARMAFDEETLRPLYRLELGKSGESCALVIARRLHMPEALLLRAHQEVYGEQATPLPAFQNKKSALKRKEIKKSGPDLKDKWRMGDSVQVLPQNETAIVYRPADEKGDVIVQLKGVKYFIRHDRLRLNVPAESLYPPDYDFSIIFDTVKNRKARHVMNKRYDESAVINEEDLSNLKRL